MHSLLLPPRGARGGGGAALQRSGGDLTVVASAGGQFSPSPTASRSRSHRRATRLRWQLLALASAAPAFAQADNDLHGRLEVQDADQFTGPDSIEAQLGEQTANDGLGNLRLTWEPTWGTWSLQLHYVVGAEDWAPTSLLAHAEAGLIPQPPATLFDLTDTFVNHGPWLASQSIDRLAITYATPDWWCASAARRSPGAAAWCSGRWTCSTPSRPAPPTPNTSRASTCSTSSACSPMARTCS